MRTPSIALVLLLAGTASAAPASWQTLNEPTAAEVAAQFGSPPPEYGVTLWWGWDGKITPDVIDRDLDAMAAKGIRAVTIEPGYGMAAPYLSPGWFENIRTAVEAAKRRGMRVWLADEGKYPSGFAGGKFSAERPDLRMQALTADRIDVMPGTTIARPLPPDTVAVTAVSLEGQGSQVVDISSGQLQWTAPEGMWQLVIVRHVYESSPTRAVSNPTRGKDDKNSLEDYLNPAATRQFLDWTEEQYAKCVGDEFGKTVLGFRGDEPDYSIEGIPWTPRIFDDFQRSKGYDVRLYLGGFFASTPTEEQKRAKADYWDVWSDLFRDGFFRPQGEWCAAHGLEYLVHLNHEDQMTELVRSEGDFFKDMRYVEVPGIDTIWHQIWPGKVSDFPKYASSAAHVFGRRRAFTESFAAYRPPPTVAQARWIMNQQYVRGINLQELMFVPASTTGKSGFHGWMADAEFPAAVAYANRATFLLAQGRPAAQIAVYYPTLSLWLGDPSADRAVLALTQELLAGQRDFDFINEEAFATALTQEGGSLRNLSGQSYQVVIVPPCRVISKLARARLQAFAAAGGKVVVLGAGPSLEVDRTFLRAAAPPDWKWAIRETAPELNPAVLAALPAPDAALDRPCPDVKVLHRRWRDADLYFFFNESAQPQSCAAMLAGSGPVQAWDANTGAIEDVQSTPAGAGSVRVPLALQPYGTKFVVIGSGVTAPR